MKVKVECGRLVYEPRHNYRDGILIGGNWFEDKLQFVKEKHNHTTNYDNEYYDKGICFNDPDIIWRQYLHAEGPDPRVMFDQYGKKYHNNHSSTYDLSYNHLPKLYKYPNLRRYRPILHSYSPQQDYTENYGSITSFGLREAKKRKWDYDVLVDTLSWTTENRDRYVAPKKSEYTFNRRGISLDYSSKLLKVNTQFIDLPLRNQLISVVPDTKIDVATRVYPHFYY